MWPASSRSAPHSARCPMAQRAPPTKCWSEYPAGKSNGWCVTTTLQPPSPHSLSLMREICRVLMRPYDNLRPRQPIEKSAGVLKLGRPRALRQVAGYHHQMRLDFVNSVHKWIQNERIHRAEMDVGKMRQRPAHSGSGAITRKARG